MHVSVYLVYGLHLLYHLLLQIIFAITQNQLVMPKCCFSENASTLIKRSHIRARSESDPDSNPGQWVIWISNADLISTLERMQSCTSSYHAISKANSILL